MPYDYDDLGEYGRARDRVARKECDLPTTGPEAPRRSGPSPADLDEAFGTYRPTPSAAEQRRIGRDSTWRR